MLVSFGRNQSGGLHVPIDGCLYLLCVAFHVGRAGAECRLFPFDCALSFDFSGDEIMGAEPE